MIGPPPICDACARLRPRDDGPGLMCDAFSDGIPDDVYFGGFDHREAHHGDGGIRFLLEPGAEDRLANYESGVAQSRLE